MHNFADPVALAIPLCFIAMVCENPFQFKNALMRQKVLDCSPHALSSSIRGREIGTRHFCCILPGGPSVSPFLAAHVGLQIMICQNDCSAVGAFSYPPPKVSALFFISSEGALGTWMFFHRRWNELYESSNLLLDMLMLALTWATIHSSKLLGCGVCGSHIYRISLLAHSIMQCLSCTSWWKNGCDVNFECFLFFNMFLFLFFHVSSLFFEYFP